MAYVASQRVECTLNGKERDHEKRKVFRGDEPPHGKRLDEARYTVMRFGYGPVGAQPTTPTAELARILGGLTLEEYP